VFTNLLLNALDAMPTGGEVRIRTWEEGDLVLASVADSGVGMPEEVRRRVFDPFFTTKGEQGTGLGLSVTYSILTRHNGKIWVESREGMGTVFTVRLPAYRGEQPPPRKEPTLRKGRVGRLLIIEDEERVKNILIEMLEEAGHSVRGTRHGEEGLAILHQEAFDLVITDLGMPGMNGWEVIQRIRERDSRLPVVVITGWGLKGEEDRRRLWELGVSRCLFKPVRIQELLQAVNDLLSE
jgi:CheY-like chemotaxis protein